MEIEVESMDKGGNFIGYLFTKEGNENLSELLVKWERVDERVDELKKEFNTWISRWMYEWIEE